MNTPVPPFADAEIKAAFAAFPSDTEEQLLQLRQLIFEVAAETPGVGTVEESLKWGQPSYQSKCGTPIRLGMPKTGGYALFTHCQSSVMREFKEVAPDHFRFDGGRAVEFSIDTKISKAKLTWLIRRALTYRQKPR